jgi:hypothetical protein
MAYKQGMTSRNLLYSFSLLDKFGLTDAQLLEEAKVAAARRAELAGWSVLEVVKSPLPSKKLDDEVSHQFDIYGLANEAEKSGKDVDHQNISKSSGFAAQEPKL